MREVSGRRLSWFKMYSADWRADPGLRACSLAARGLWIDMLTLMFEATPCGHLLVSGQPPDAARLARVLGCLPDEIEGALAELEAADVFSRTEAGVIYSRRMVRDAQQAVVDRENGRTGGNPRLKGAADRRVNPPANPPDKPSDMAMDKVRAHAYQSQNPDKEDPSFILDPDRPSAPSSRQTPTAAPAGFDEFWEAFPRRQGKAEARRAYANALKHGATASEIVEGARRYRPPLDAQFTPMPTTWLNQGRWADEPFQPAASSTPRPTGPTTFTHGGKTITLDDMAEAL